MGVIRIVRLSGVLEGNEVAEIVAVEVAGDPISINRDIWCCRSAILPRVAKHVEGGTLGRGLD